MCAARDLRFVFVCLLLVTCHQRIYAGDPNPLVRQGADLPTESTELTRGSSKERSLAKGASHRYALRMRKGESAEVVVTQLGVDVVLELFAPDGKRIGSADAPTGRAGDEHLEIVAEADGTYQVLVRPFDQSEPEGKYRIVVATWRDEQETQREMAKRAEARRLAAEWLKARSGPFRLHDGAIDGRGLERFDALAKQHRILGLGEATHGSREFGDVRLALTRRLVERHGVRVITLEASAARMRGIDAWCRGSAGNGAELARLFGPGWINRRSFQALAQFVREWNRAHPTDQVMLVGLDAQDNAPARETLAAFAGKVFDSKLTDRLGAVLKRLTAADAEAAVFGPSNMRADDWRFLKQLLAALDLEQPVLAARFGERAFEEARSATRDLVQFAEFNTDAREEIHRSRDWFMAANILRAAGTRTRAVYWGHNAHVAHPPGRPGSLTTAGQIMRDLLGPGYGSVAVSFREGGFLAQLPDDPPDRLALFSVGPTPPESIDAVLDAMGLGEAISAWPDDGRGAAPAWLAQPREMHWIGGLFSDAWLPHQSTRAYQLLSDFDGVVFFRKVSAETVPEIGKRRAP